MDFFVRDARTLVSVEVKARNGATISLRNMIRQDRFPAITCGIKLAERNVGFENGFYTFPLFLVMHLRRFLASQFYPVPED